MTKAKTGTRRNAAGGPPQLTAEQRSAAAAAAVQARRRRAEVKGQFEAGQLGIGDVLDLVAGGDEAVGKMRVFDLLQSVPRVGPVRAQAMMESLGIAPSRRLRGLGEHQRDRLVEHFEGM
ncbi:MAG: integration host factor, actinobacterial type [Candidatus Nanopelagicales bacterium]